MKKNTELKFTVATVGGKVVGGESRMVSLAGLKHLKLLQRGSLTESDVAELAASMAREGQIAPIVLCNDAETIIAGERRVAAARLNAWSEISAIVTAIKPESGSAYSASAAENRERTQIDWIGCADYYLGLIKRGVFKNGKEAAEGLGVSAPTMSQYLTCAKYLTAEEKGKARDGKLTFKVGYKVAAERAKAKRVGGSPGPQAPQTIPAVSLDGDRLVWQAFSERDEAGNTGALHVEFAIPLQDRPATGKDGWSWVISEIRDLVQSFEARSAAALAKDEAEKAKDDGAGAGENEDSEPE